MSNHDTPHPDYDVTDTPTFRLDLWQRVTKIETTLNGVNPPACRREMKTHMKYITVGVVTLFLLFSALFTWLVWPRAERAWSCNAAERSVDK